MTTRRMAHLGYFREWPVTCDGGRSLYVMNAYVRVGPAASATRRRCAR